MDYIVNIAWVLLGFAGLIIGADFLVRGGSGIARSLGINPLVVGLTIVAYGTSMPEFMASFIAVWTDNPGIALGNVLGSNIFNIAMVLGISAIIIPIEIEREVLFIQIPILIGVTLLMIPIGLTGNRISRLEGILLLLGIILYTLFSFYRSKRNIQPIDLEPTDIWAKHQFLSALIVVVGCVSLYFGGSWVVSGSTAIAHKLNVDERIVGCTLVAIGTSLPELVTSVIGILRRETEIGVGNAIGSCLFNLLMVIGGAAMINDISSNWWEYRLEIGFTLLVAVIIWPMTFSRRLLTRKMGIILVMIYVLFNVMLIIQQFS